MSGFTDVAVERAAGQAVESFQDSQAASQRGVSDVTYADVIRWADLKAPPYRPDSRRRDKWLIDFVKLEPHLAAILGQVCSLVANRGWSLTGGRNTVGQVRRIFRDVDKHDGARFGPGWRAFARRLAASYYNTDLGALIEWGRAGELTEDYTPPLAAMWSADPTRFRLTGKPITPLAFTAAGYTNVPDALLSRITANPAILDKYNGLGYCAISIIVELAKILIAVYRYDAEQLGAHAPRGLLLLHGIGERQWQNAMKSRKVQLDGMEREFFDLVAILSTTGPVAPEAKLVAISNLPSGFNREQFITFLIYLYSLAFEFPPDEFWPIQTGGLGRSREAEIQMQRATQKGDASFFQGLQEMIQRELPSAGGNAPLILFEFDQRSDTGRQVEADVAKTWAEVAATLYTAGLDPALGGVGLLTREQALSLLVDKGVLPAEYTDVMEESEAFDTQKMRTHRYRRHARENEGLWRAARLAPADPIIAYHWPTGQVYTLYDSGLDFTAPGVWRGVTLEDDHDRFQLLIPTLAASTNGGPPPASPAGPRRLFSSMPDLGQSDGL